MIDLVGIFKVGILLLILIPLLTISFFLISIPTRKIVKETHQINSPKTLEPKETVLSSSISANLAFEPKVNVEVISVAIIEVIDIDSLRVLLNDGMQVVDLIGVKVPTSTSQNRYEACYSEPIEASIQKMVLGKKAYLVADEVLNDESFKYVFLEDLTFLNFELIKEGITSATISEDYLYRKEFEQARASASDQSVGVWFDTCPIAKPTPTKIAQASKTTPTPTPTIINPYAHLIPSASPTPTRKPTPTPLPTSAPPVLKASTPSLNQKPGSLNPEILFVLINNHRKSIGKQAFEKDERLCQLAKDRGPELYDEIFVTHNVHAGLQNRSLPYWITENMAHYDTEEQVFNWWMGSTIHRRAIESDHKYSCGECVGKSCAQLFTSWTPK